MITYLLIGFLLTLFQFLFIDRSKILKHFQDMNPILFLLTTVTIIILQILFWPAEIAYFFWQEFGQDIKYIFNGRKR